MTPPKDPVAKRATTVRLTGVTYGALRDYAHDENLSQSEVVEAVLRDFFTEHYTSKCARDKARAKTFGKRPA